LQSFSVAGLSRRSFSIGDYFSGIILEETHQFQISFQMQLFEFRFSLHRSINIQSMTLHCFSLYHDEVFLFCSYPSGFKQRFSTLKETQKQSPNNQTPP
jgi:hypothetical protein